MSEPKVVFEYARDNMYCKLESREQDSRVASASVQQIGIIEEIGTLSPTVTMLVKDVFGHWTTINALSNAAKYEFTYGHKVEQTETIDLKINGYSADGAVATSMAEQHYHIDFMDYRYDQVLHRQKSRAWEDRKVGDVVEELLVESGYPLNDIESGNARELTVQPNISNGAMLFHLAQVAHNGAETPLSGFVYAFRLDGQVMFKSLDTLLKKAPVRVLEMGFDPDGEEKKFLHLNIRNRYSGSINLASGVNASHFNYETGEFVNTPVTFSDLEHSRLTHYTGVHQSSTDTANTIHYGRDVESVPRASRKMLVSMMNLTTSELIMTFDPTLHVGDVVTVELPTHEETEGIDGVQFGGEWLIVRVNHQLHVDPDNEAYTTLTLVREGHNGELLGDLEK